MTDVFSGVIQSQKMEDIIWLLWMILDSIHGMPLVFFF